MIKTCDICGGFIATLCTCDEDDVFAENKRYREALERISGYFPPTHTLGYTMKQIALEALNTYSQVSTDDERKAVQEHIDRKAHITP